MGNIGKNTFDGVKEILSIILKIKPDSIVLESKLQADLGIDSVDFWDVVASLQKKFKYRITNEEAMSLITVSDLVNVLDQRIKK